MRPIKILALIKNAMDGVTWYRLHNFAKQARIEGIASVEFLDPTLDAEELYQVLKEADAFYIRINETLPIIFEELNLENATKPIILDMDDSFEDINPLSDMYQTMGIQEVKLGDGSYLWKDGEKGFSIEENKERLDSYRKLVSQAHAVIVTTFELKQFAEKFNENVVIIPNAINFDLFPVLPLKKDNTITITWSGGASHFADLNDIKPQLKQIMEENLNVYYYHTGQMFKAIIKDLPQNRVKTGGWVTADGHGFRMACLNADIGIAPLIDNAFNRCKSSVKFYEYSALKIPTVARRIPPYSDDIVEGETGLLYDTPEEFKTKVEYLIKNPLERMRLAQNAYDYVFKSRNIVNVTREWVDFFRLLSEIMKKKSIKKGVRVVNYKEFDPFPLKDTPQAERIMDEGCSLLESLGIKYWISAGTLLGLVRNKGFIPHDTDIDTVVVEVDAQLIDETFKRNGFERIREMTYDELPAQYTYEKDKVLFDIEFYYKGDGNYVFYSDSGEVCMPEKFAKLKKVALNERRYPAPSPVHEYLRWRYGDWETPKREKAPWQREFNGGIKPYKETN